MLPRLASADIVIIAHPSLNIDTLTRNQASQLFLGKVKTTAVGEKPRLYELPDDDNIKTVFYQQLMNKSLTQLQSYWARKLFSGQATYIPVALQNSQQMLTTVANNENAIGFIWQDDLNSQVKVLLTLAEE